MDDKTTKNYAETLSRSMILIGMAGLLVDAFKGLMEDAKVRTAKELEEAMEKLEENE